MAAQHGDEVVQAVDYHRQPQVVGLGVEEAEHQPGHKGEHHRGEVHVGHAENQGGGHNGEPDAVLPQGGEHHAPEGELLHKGHQHGGDGNVQQHHLEGFSASHIAGGGLIPKAAKEIADKSGGVVAQQRHGQAAQHTEEAAAEAHLFKL